MEQELKSVKHELFLAYRKGGGLFPHGKGAAAHVSSDMICSLFTGRGEDCFPWKMSCSTRQ
jgi:hypothetical protein